MYLNIYSSIIYNSQDMEVIYVVINRMDKKVTEWDITQPQKEWCYTTCNNINGLGGCYAK